MQTHAGHFCEHDVAHDDDVLNFVGNAAEAHFCRERTGVHAASALEILVLTMAHEEHIVRLAVGHGLAQNTAVGDGFSVFGESDDASIPEKTDLGDLLTFLALGDGRCWQHICVAEARRFIFNVANDRHIVDDRERIWHGDNGCETAGDG